jgi:two-component system, cell cycle sensor histidine kinase and response regulator CckA
LEPNLLSLALEAADLGSWSYDLANDRATCDERARRHFALAACGPFPLAELLGHVHPDDAALLRDAIARSATAASEESSAVELRVVASAGGARWLSVRLIVQFEGEGADRHATLTFGTSQDVTGRRRAEEALAASENMYRTLVEAADDGIVLTDLEGHHLFTNSAYFRNLGFRREELPEVDGLSLVHPDDQPRVRSEMAALLEHGTLNGEYRVRHRDGRWLHHHTTATLIRDASGRPSAVLSIIRDTTERKQAEEALAQANRQFASIFRVLPDLYFRMQGDGTIVDYKAGRREDLYVSPDQFMGRRMQAVLPNEVGRQVEMAIRQALAGEDAAIEYLLRMPAGSQTFEARVVALGEDEVVTIVRDISERKRAEVDRLELERRLLQAQKLESLGVLAGGIAHDFNNLLMAILGHLDLATQRLSRASPVLADLEHATRATQRATDLTRQMLAYSGKGHFVVAPLDLNELVRENVGLLRTAIARTVTFNLELAREPAVVEADPGQVQQVVMNLITNASEAIADQPGVVTLTTGVMDCDEQYLCRSRLEQKPAPGWFAFLEVADTGCGMSGETLDRLFDPFYSTKFTGRGLGMSAVLGIVRGHRGAILVDSVAGRGSTIRVLFPVCQAAPGSDSARFTDARSEPGAVRSRGTILVVEDDESVRELCQQYVRQIGYECLAVASGEEALPLFEAMADDIVVVMLDLSMPGMDGVTTFAELTRRRPDARVLMMSGFSEDDVMHRFPGPAPAGFLQKPFRLVDLSAKVRSLLAGS